MPNPALICRVLLVVLFALPAAPPASGPWDKAPEQWDLRDVYRILRDSPWTPTETKLEASYTQGHTDTLTGIVNNSPTNVPGTGVIRGVQVSREKSSPAYSLLWWSSKTIRLARQRLQQLQHPGTSKEPLKVEESSEYIVVLEGSDPFEILRNAKEDLHDTVFLEIAGGLSLDLASTKFVEGVGEEEDRVEFHFPREMEGHPAIDPDVDRVTFHCRATARTPHPGRENSLSFHAVFRPAHMHARGASDL
jgi:hypothetical protein